jgi:hypothetical protein
MLVLQPESSIKLRRCLKISNRLIFGWSNLIRFNHIRFTMFVSRFSIGRTITNSFRLFEFKVDANYGRWDRGPRLFPIKFTHQGAPITSIEGPQWRAPNHAKAEPFYKDDIKVRDDDARGADALFDLIDGVLIPPLHGWSEES